MLWQQGTDTRTRANLDWPIAPQQDRTKWIFHSSTYLILIGSSDTTSPCSILPKRPRHMWAKERTGQPSWEAVAGRGVACHLPRYLGDRSLHPGLIPLVPCSPCFPLWLWEVLVARWVAWVLETLTRCFPCLEWWHMFQGFTMTGHSWTCYKPE